MEINFHMPDLEVWHQSVILIGTPGEGGCRGITMRDRYGEQKLEADIVVIGGGMAGISAAIAAARMGAATILLQDRTVLGGNASSEIRMHIAGATRHGIRPNLRETGIIEEILLENKYRNPEHSYALFDTLLWEKVKYQENLELYLNTYVNGVRTEGRKILSVSAFQTTTEKKIEVYGRQFIDCSGDGMISALAGARYMFGREGRDVFGEPNAVEKSDTVTMGNSIQFRALDAGHKVAFERPVWAYDYSGAKWAEDMKWVEISSGYWWLETGGTEWNVVEDAEVTRDEMLRIVFGIWDYIKNHSNVRREAENYYLDWISFLPAKRESRRIVGDYVLKEQDILENRIFDDAVAYGGWHLDSHRPEGFYAHIHRTPQVEDRAVSFEGIYTIPYRCIYAKDRDNLFTGGRILSASHRAFSSTRVMATCAVAAQAAGVAAVHAVRSGCRAGENIRNIRSIQQELLRQGCYIPGFANEDEKDLARSARVSAKSHTEGFKPENVINGISRPVGDDSNMWQSGELREPQSITLSWEEPRELGEIQITFDSDLSAEIMISLSKWHHARQGAGVPESLVKDYRVEYLLGGEKVAEKTIRDNHQRVNRIKHSVRCDGVRITVLGTHGCRHARICEVRAYEGRGG